MLKEAYMEIAYLKGCCKKAGEELAKYTFEYDEKPKNLVVQAKDLNIKYYKFLKDFEKIKDIGIRRCDYFPSANCPNMDIILDIIK